MFLLIRLSEENIAGVLGNCAGITTKLFLQIFSKQCTELYYNPVDNKSIPFFSLERRCRLYNFAMLFFEVCLCPA